MKYKSHILVLLVGVGLGCGVTTLYQGSTTQQPIPPVTKTVVLPPTPSPLPPPKPVEQAKPAETPTQTPEEVRLRLLTERKTKGWMPQLTPLEMGKFSLNLGLILGLSPAEMNALDRALDEARREVEATQKSNTTYAKGPEGSQLVQVAASPAGGPAYQKLLSQVNTILGPEKMKIFNEIAGEQFDAIYDSFGAKGLRYDIRPAAQNGPEGTLQYDVKRETLGADGTVEGSSFVTLPKQSINDPNLQPILDELGK